MVFLKEFFEKVDFDKNHQTTKKQEEFPRGKSAKEQNLKFYTNMTTCTTVANGDCVIAAFQCI